MLLAGVIGLFVLTTGLLYGKGQNGAVVRVAKAWLGISDEPLFDAELEPRTSSRRLRVACSMLPELSEPWQRKEVDFLVTGRRVGFRSSRRDPGAAAPCQRGNAGRK